MNAGSPRIANESGSRFPGKLSRWVRREGRFEVAILAALFLAAAGCWGFGLLAEKVAEGDTRKFDEHVLVALRTPGNLAVPIGPSWAFGATRDVTVFGGPVGLGLITAAVSGFLVLQRRYGLLTFMLASLVSGTLLNLALKALFQRPRPQIVPHLAEISASSFPSGHSMISSIGYLTMASLLARTVQDERTKIYFFVVAAVLVGLIGFSRVYLGVHYPTDVLAGWCVGSAWAAICSLVAQMLAERRSVPEAQGRVA